MRASHFEFLKREQLPNKALCITQIFLKFCLHFRVRKLPISVRQYLTLNNIFKFIPLENQCKTSLLCSNKLACYSLFFARYGVRKIWFFIYLNNIKNHIFDTKWLILMSMANHNWSRYELSRTRIYRPEKNLRVTLSQIMIITSSLLSFWWG